MKKKIKAAIEKLQSRKDELANSDNPQVKEICAYLRGKIDGLEAVLDALYGNNVLLNIMAEK